MAATLERVRGRLDRSPLYDGTITPDLHLQFALALRAVRPPELPGRRGG
jgi:hypothetical protein